MRSILQEKPGVDMESTKAKGKISSGGLWVEAGEVRLEGDLVIPEQAKALVVFAHGSGSSRLSPRNRYVAGTLNKAGLATLLFDLLTPQEEERDIHTGEFRFNTEFLTRRLIAAIEWAAKDYAANLKIGCFGASTGAAACLVAAAKVPEVVSAVVSRGGRPDLAENYLTCVRAPTLLIVGGVDMPVIGMNRQALNKLDTKKKLVIIPGAGHLFEEAGALEEVADLAKDWFLKHLR